MVQMTHAQFSLFFLVVHNSLYENSNSETFFFLSCSRLCHYSAGAPGGTFVSMNRFSTLCG
jgi:hypothetical protein